MSLGTRERRVAGNQWGVQRLRKSQIRGIVRRYVQPELPDSREKKVMWVSGQRKRSEILNRRKRPARSELVGQRVTA